MGLQKKNCRICMSDIFPEYIRIYPAISTIGSDPQQQPQNRQQKDQRQQQLGSLEQLIPPSIQQRPLTWLRVEMTTTFASERILDFMLIANAISTTNAGRKLLRSSPVLVIDFGMDTFARNLRLLILLTVSSEVDINYNLSIK